MSGEALFMNQNATSICLGRPQSRLLPDEGEAKRGSHWGFARLSGVGRSVISRDDALQLCGLSVRLICWLWKQEHRLVPHGAQNWRDSRLDGKRYQTIRRRFMESQLSFPRLEIRVATLLFSY
jgi:hypothetical protein